jgi:hypothetical protein
MAALLAGPWSTPKLVRCQAVLPSDPKIPQSEQPSYAAFDRPEKEGKALTKKLGRMVAGTARKSVHELLKQVSVSAWLVRRTPRCAGKPVLPGVGRNRCSLLERFAGPHSQDARLLRRRSCAQQPKTAEGPADLSPSWGPSTCGRVPCVFPRRSIGTRHTKESRIQECKTPGIM